jgi:hypothetical protein
MSLGMRTGSAVIAAAFLAAFFELPLAAAPTHIQLFSAEKSPTASCRGGVLRAVPRCGSDCDSRTLSAPWTLRSGSAESEFSLAPELSWEITIEGRGCWAAPLVIAAGNNGETRTTFVWPAAVIGGHLVVQRGESAPKELRASVQADTGAVDTSIPETPLRCIVDGTHWQCTLPSTKADLRFAAHGFVPRYIWGLEVAPGVQRTLDLALVRGSSVSGRVTFAIGRADVESVTVSLRPVAAVNSMADERRLIARSRTAKPNPRGFFQFSDVADGMYEVIAAKTGWSRAVRQIRIGGATESDAGVLTLPPLVRTEVIIDPPLDTKGRAWRIVLNRDEPAMQPRPPVADKQAGANGEWTQNGVEAGTYKLDVYDGGGVAYEHLIVHIKPNDAPLRFHMDAISVRGTLRLGDDGLAAVMRFTNLRGSGEVELVSEDDGVFVGTFPALGRYDLDVAPRGSAQHLNKLVDVRENGDGVVNLDIRLPNGVVHGTVVDESGTPVSGTVHLHRSGSRPITTTSGDDGSFRIIGVEHGDVVLNARSRRFGDSGPVSHDVGDATSEPVTLTLHARREVTLWIVSSSGQPVSGAVIRFINRFDWHEEVTGPGGDAHWELPRGFDSIDVIICAAAFPIRIVKLPITAEMDTNPQLVLGNVAAKLIVNVGNAPPWPAMRRDGANVDLHWLPDFFSSPMGGPSFANKTSRGFEFDVDPGSYTFCQNLDRSSKCMQKVLPPGTETVVDLSSWTETPR